MELLGDDSIRYELKKQEIKKGLHNDIAKLPEFRTRKMDINLLNAVMNMIENSVKKKYEIDKKFLLFEIYDSVFGKLSDEEKATLAKNIIYLLKSGLVVKYGRIRKFWIQFRKYFAIKS